MKVEVKTNGNDYITLENVEKIEVDELGYYFEDDEGEPALYVPHVNLAYWKQT